MSPDESNEATTPTELEPYSRFRIFFTFFRMPLTFSEYIVSIDLTSLWRRHLVWAKKDGDELLRIVTARFTSTSVILSLLVSAEIGVFFSPSDICTSIRHALSDDLTETLEYWTAIVLIISIFFSIAALIANFTAWSIFVVTSKENAAIVFRSSIGLYAAQLPSRLMVLTVYMFFAWVAMFWWILLSQTASLILTLAGAALIMHIATTYSAMGRVLMATSAMGHHRILKVEHEERLTPSELSTILLRDTETAIQLKVPVNQQYRMKYHELVEKENVGLLQRTKSFRRRFNLPNLHTNNLPGLTRRHPAMEARRAGTPGFARSGFSRPETSEKSDSADSFFLHRQEDEKSDKDPGMSLGLGRLWKMTEESVDETRDEEMGVNKRKFIPGKTLSWMETDEFVDEPGNEDKGSNKPKLIPGKTLSWMKTEESVNETGDEGKGSNKRKLIPGKTLSWMETEKFVDEPGNEDKGSNKPKLIPGKTLSWMKTEESVNETGVGKRENTERVMSPGKTGTNVPAEKLMENGEAKGSEHVSVSLEI